MKGQQCRKPNSDQERKNIRKMKRPWPSSDKGNILGKGRMGYIIATGKSVPEQKVSRTSLRCSKITPPKSFIPRHLLSIAIL